ncbi:hypothetical protein ME1_00660 [Bartonella vinsonii subsp. arupensis OK-94-513]|uniref:Uncharacterized protein n=2 Tax=Bartonella vinsonii subsp. arupensis TaxID=110578 RepID=J0QR98_BARVI|nr:hypothetical protein ME1_00660 [Bartonella vinsonii subsp. arupensis OK-94-513]EJF97449.1 hypothetical protein MEI_01143 [Bartonella vinsonii subsp. arupensis Pm136co]
MIFLKCYQYFLNITKADYTINGSRNASLFRKNSQAIRYNITNRVMWICLKQEKNSLKENNPTTLMINKFLSGLIPIGSYNRKNICYLSSTVFIHIPFIKLLCVSNASREQYNCTQQKKSLRQAYTLTCQKV